MTTFAEAFRRQAAADLKAYETMDSTTLPTSQRLHYLQMWLEKLCKAYLWLPTSSMEEELRLRHNVIEKVLPRLIIQRWRHLEAFEAKPDNASLRDICREIDLLHPQIDDGGRRPDNVEYPWKDKSGESQVPAEFKFPLASRLYNHTGRQLLKASVQLIQEPDIFMSEPSSKQ